MVVLVHFGTVKYVKKSSCVLYRGERHIVKIFIVIMFATVGYIKTCVVNKKS